MTAYTIRNLAGDVIAHTDHATLEASYVLDNMQREVLQLQFRATGEDGEEITGRFVGVAEIEEDERELLAWVADPGPKVLIVDARAFP